MKRFEMVKQILDTLVSGQSFGGHRAFWRDLSLYDFPTYRVFGKQLLKKGDSANSNLILALRAQYPFGSDVGTEGAYFRRMPAGRLPATQAQIDYIARWIDDGCPDDDDIGLYQFAVPGHQDTAHHNSYWREFDDWAMFNTLPDVKSAIDDFFESAPKWFNYAKSPAEEQKWDKDVKSKAVQSAIALLSDRQAKTVERFYGSPPDLDDLFDSYKRFGSGTLPPDPLRPQDPYHNMNGREMWFFWAAFVDGAIRSNMQKSFWFIEGRAILVGLLHDGLFRGRFDVQGFTRDSAGSTQILAFARGISDADLCRELRTRFVQSGM